MAGDSGRRLTGDRAGARRRNGASIGLVRLSTRSGVAAACMLGVALLLALVLGAVTQSRGRAAPGSFAQRLVGDESRSPFVLHPKRGVELGVTDDAFVARNRGSRLVFRLRDGSGDVWVRHASGATRRTSFGTEVVKFGLPAAEEFLVVDRHLGRHTFTWDLGAGVRPVVTGGSIALVDDHGRALNLQVSSPRILDLRRRDITPAGLAWSTARSADGWQLQLQVDDHAFPKRYVIDPAVTFRASATTQANAATTVSLTLPASTASGDLVIVELSVNNPASASFTSGGTSTACTALTRFDSTAGAGVQQLLYWGVAAAGDAGKTCVLSWTGAAEVTSIAAVYTTGTYYTATPVDFASPAGVTAAAATTYTTNSLQTYFSSEFLAVAVTEADTKALGVPTPGTWVTEANQTNTSGATKIRSAYYDGATRAGAGSSTVSGTVGNPGAGSVAAAFGIRQSDTTAPTVSLATPAANAKIRNGQSLTATLADEAGGSGPQKVAYYYCVGNVTCNSSSGSPTLIGQSSTASTYAVTWSSQPANGTYTLFAKGYDNAGNSTDSSSIAVTVDNTAPTAAITSPATGQAYRAATLSSVSPITGTAADAGGSGLATVSVTIQSANGNYWNGASWQAGATSIAATGTSSWTAALGVLTGDGDGTYTITATAADGSGNTGTAVRTFVYDSAAPTVSNVSSTTADGAYRATQSVAVTVAFSENVTVTGTPTLALNSGGSASYSSGSGTSTLTFTYTIAGGENSSDLDYSATSSLALAGGTIKDSAGNNATLTLPAVGGASSLGGQKAIVIDTAAPTSSVSTPPSNGTSYSPGTLPASFAGSSGDTGGSSSVSSVQVAIQDGSGNYWNGTTFGSASITYNATGGSPAAWTYSTATLAGQLTDGHTYTITALATDPAGNTGTSTRTFTYDATAPTISSVNSSTANGSYKAGAAVSIQVAFSEAVTVTGTPTLALNSGGSASYSSGSGSSTLTFTYTVAAGENSADLDYNTTTSLALAGGTIKDGAGNSATLTLPTVGGASSLGGQKAIVIDTTAPTVSNVTSSTANGSYEAGASIAIQVTFSEAVTVTGTPTLALNSGGSASYSSGSGTATLTFTYTVGAGETSADLDYSATSSLALAGGTIKDAATNNATLTLPTVGGASSLGGQKNIVVDTTVPTVTNVTSSTADGSYKVGASISIQMSFSEAVTVTGTPTLALNSGGSASYSSGSGTSTLTFSYTVGAGETSADLDYAATSSLALAGGTIRDAATNNATLTLPTVGGASSLGGQKAIAIDTTAPTISNVTSSTADGSYKAGATISIQVSFSEAVTVTGTLTLALNSGGSASYSSGSGTSTLTFSYTVGAGETSGDLDYSATSSLALAGGTIRDAATNNATLTLPTVGGASSLGGQTTIVVDTTAPTVSSVNSSTADGGYKAGATISIQVSFNEAVTVTGTPTLALNSGGSASYSSGSGTSTLTFSYTIGAGETSGDLDYSATNSLALAGGTIRDAATNNATLTLPAVGGASSLGGQKAIVVDTTAPTVSSVTSSTADGAYKAGATISIQVSFNEAVTVTGTPTLALDSGGSASYSSGSGSSTLTFTYTVGAGETSGDLDYSATSSLTLAGGTIKDAATNNATLTLPTVGGASSLGGQKAIVIDTTAPTVSSVTSSTADGAYRAGASISIQVSLNEAVTVTGTPTLALNSGGSASYSSGSGSSTLTFAYTVGAGENAADLDYAATTSLALAGGTIRDAATNNATLTLPAVGGASSLGGQKTIVVDTTAPTVSSVNSSTPDGAYKTGASISIQVSFSEPVTVTGTPTLALTSGGSASYSSGSGSATLTFTYTVAAGENAADLDYAATNSLALAGGTIKDVASNDATLTLPTVGGASSLGGQKAIVIDTTAPTVSSVSSSTANGAYSSGASISIQIAFSEPVTVTGTPTLALTSGGSASYSSGSGSSTLTFTYTVGAGENSADLDYAATNSLALAGGSIRDAATNNATITLPTVGGASSLGGQKAIAVDTADPTAAIATPAADGDSYNGSALPSTLSGSSADTGGSSSVSSVQIAIQDGSGNYWGGATFNQASPTYTATGGTTTAWTYATATLAPQLTDGHTYTITARATDPAGNTGTATRTFTYDSTAPAVTGVSATNADGVYTTGQVIHVQVSFAEPVDVSGTPTLALNTTPSRTADYVSGSGTSTLTFDYTVHANDEAADLDYASTGALTLNGGSIEDAATNGAALTLPAVGGAFSLGGEKDITIETLAPFIESVSASNADGAYKQGDTIHVLVTFNKPVTVAGGTPGLALNSTPARSATYVSGSGTATLQFDYTVQAGDSATRLDAASSSALSLNGATIRDASAVDAALTVATGSTTTGALANAKNLEIDTTIPGVTNVTSSPATATYRAGQTVNLTVSFSEPVTVTGTPALALNTGTSAVYVSGSGSVNLTFAYIVGGSDNVSALAYTGTGALSSNGGTIRDAAANDATLTLAAPGSGGSLDANTAITIDTTAPTVSISTPPSNGTLYGASTLPSALAGSSADGGSGVSSVEIAIRDGAGNYWSGADFDQPSIAYNPAGGTSASWTYATATLATKLATGHTYTITSRATDAAGNLSTATRTFLYDSSIPTVTNVTASNASGAYRAGDVIHIQITFDENVNVTGSPTLTLDTTPARDATFVAGSGTSTLEFDYTIQAGDNTAALDYASAGALVLGGGTIRDAAANDASPTLPAPGATGSLSANKAVVVDTLAPTVSSVSASNPDGSYKAGDVIHVRVDLSESVTVTGTPTLTLNTTPAQVASYASGGGTAALTFDYTVQAGDSAVDLDYAAVGSLALAGGSIRDAAGNDAVTTLPVVGGAQSLGGQKNIVVDTVAPTVTSLTVSGTTLDATYSEALAGSPATTDFAVLVDGSPVAVDGVSISGGSTVRLTLHDAVHHLDAVTVAYSGILVTDPAGNVAATYAAQSVTNLTPDTAPDAPSAAAPADGTFVDSTTPTLSATFEDPDTHDFGKLVFEVCADSSCATSLGTFDSTATSLNVGQSGSAPVPGAFGLTTASRYWWRVKGVDSSSTASTFASIQAFTVDTTAPSVQASVTVGANPGYQYFDGLHTLWLNADRSGDFMLTASASDPESGIASVDFPAIAGMGGGASDTSSPYSSSSYAFDGTGTPFGTPGPQTVTARNGVTIAAALTATDQITIDADGAAPGAFSLGAPANGTKVSTGVTLSAAPTDTGSGLRQVDFVYCDRTANALCVPATQIGLSQTTPVLGIYSVSWTNAGLPDGHDYAVAAIATDNVGHVTSSAISTLVVDNSAPTIAVTAPVALTGGQYQAYDAAGRTLWLNPSGTGSFRLTAAASDPDSGIATVDFPALFGTAASSDVSSPYQSSVYSFSSPSGQGTHQITATNGVTDPAAATAGDTITISTDGTPPLDTVSFPADGASYDATSWTAGCAAAGICGSVDDPAAGVAGVEISLLDRTTGTYFDGAAFTQSSQTWVAASLAGNDWSLAIAAGALTSPHAYELEVRAADNVGNVATAGPSRFTFGSDVGAPATTLSLTGASHAALTQTAAHAYTLYYATALGGGGFALHADASDPSGVDTVAFPSLAAAPGFTGAGGTATNSGHDDPYSVDSPAYSFDSSATTAPGPRMVTSTDLRGNAGDETLTFLLDDTAPTGATVTVTPVDVNGYATTTSLDVAHLAYTSDLGSGVASSTLTVASAALSNGVCGSFGSAAPAADGPFAATSGTCYRFTVTGADRVGNVASVSQTVKVDTTAPTQPTVSFTGLSSGNTYDDGSGTLYYRPSAGGTFTVNANASTDAESGVAGYTFAPAIGSSTQTGSALAVTFGAGGIGSNAYTVHSTNNAGLDSADATFAVAGDSTPPSGGGLTVNGAAATSGGSGSYLTSGASVAIATSPYSDGGSGLASEVLTVESGTLAADTCGAYGSPATITGSAAYGVSNGHCYRFRLTATDNVGNSAALTTAVKVDTTAPVQPTVSFSGLSSGNTFAAGSTLFYRPSAGGTFTVEANGAVDPETGIKGGNGGYSFTAVGGVVSESQSGSTMAVAFDGSSNGGGAQSVTAINNAGVASSPTAFTVTPDSGAPTGGLLSIGPYSSSTTVSIAETDFVDAVSGIATNTITRSDPLAPNGSGGCPAGGYTGSATVTGSSDTVPTDGRCYEYTLTGVDRVGNSATFRTLVLVDSTGPSGGSVGYVDGLASLASVAVDWNAGTDPESGIGGIRLERATAALGGSTCGPLGGYSTLVASATTSPVVDSSVSAGNCYAYRIVVTNNAGVASTFTSSSVAKITNGSPIAQSPGNPSGVYLSGTTLWLGPSAANAPFTLELTPLARNGVDTATWQGKSGSLSSSPTSDTAASTSPFTSGAYTWDGTAPLGDSIQVTRDPGGTVDSVTVSSDVAGPTGSISYPNATVLVHSVPVSTTASDAGSGVAGVMVERSETPLVGATCGTTWTAFAAVSLSGGNDTTVGDATCYRYRAVVDDHVGNSSVFTSTDVVQIPDITAPSFASATTNAAGTTLTVTMSEPLDGAATTPAGAFVVYYNGVAQPAPSSIAFSGSTVVLGLDAPPDNSQVVTIRYTQPSSAADRVRDEATPTENETSSFGPQAVVNATPDSVAPVVLSATVNAGSLTIDLDEAPAGPAPDPSAFAVVAGGTPRTVTNVSASGSTVTLTFSPPVQSTDSVTVSYSTPAANALHDAAANVVAPFIRLAANQTPFTAPPVVTVTPPSDTLELVSAAPDDGATVRAAAAIVLTANRSAAWTAMTLTRPDGTVTQLDGGNGATWQAQLANATPGLYVVHGTLSADGRTVDVLSHFTIWADGTGAVPRVQKNAFPFAGGDLLSSDHRAELVWPGGAFSDVVVVEIVPTDLGAVSGLPESSLVVDASAFMRSTREPVHDLGGVIDVRFPDAAAGAHAVTSQTGTVWRDIPELPTFDLPAGQSDGWFRDSDQTIHVLTRHLTYYALVAPRAAAALSLRIVTVRRLWLARRPFVAVRLSLTGPARITGLFEAPGRATVQVKTIALRTRRAGITILRVPLTGTRPGLYRLQLRAQGLGQSVGRTAKIRLLATQPASPVWQDGAVRVAVVRGARGTSSLGRLLGDRFVVRRVADANLYDVVDPRRPTAAAAIVVDLGTVPASTIAKLHALLPEVRIVGLATGPRAAALARSAGVSAALPRGSSAARIAATIRTLLGR